MFYFEAVYIFVAWLLFVAIMPADYKKPPPRLGMRFGVRFMLVNVTIAAFLLGLAAVLTGITN